MWSPWTVTVLSGHCYCQQICHVPPFSWLCVSTHSFYIFVSNPLHLGAIASVLMVWRAGSDWKVLFHPQRCRSLKCKLPCLEAGHILRSICVSYHPGVILRLGHPPKWNPYLASSPSLAWFHHSCQCLLGFIPNKSPSHPPPLRVCF